MLWRVLDTARFSPSGGNVQGWRVVVVEDAEKRRRLRDLYLPAGTSTSRCRAAGLRPWSPLADREPRRRPDRTPNEHGGPRPTGRGVRRAPRCGAGLLALFVDLGALAAVDRDLDRYSFAGGASVYPFAWSVLLAAHAEGLGGVITTMCIHEEPAVKALLDAPDEMALAAVIALGYPVHRPRKLRRTDVGAFARIDSMAGEPLEP